MTWLKALKDIFNQTEEVEEKISAEIAISVLLVEMMKMDGKLEEAEEKLLIERLAHHSNLDNQEILKLAEDAHKQIEEATDYHQFTHVINKQLSLDEKLSLLESLWMIAAVDGHIDAHENHFIRKISDLLHLRHSEFMKIKDKVLKSSGLK